MFLKSKLVVLFSLILLPLATLVGAENLLPQSSFKADMGHLPTGWRILGDYTNKFSVVSEGGIVFTRVMTTEPGSVLIEWRSPALKDVTNFTLTGRVRAKGITPGKEEWRSGRVAVQLMDGGKRVADSVTTLPKGETDWKDIKIVAKAAKYDTFLVHFGFIGGSGELDVADLVLVKTP